MLRDALLQISQVCPPNMFRLNGIDPGALARDALQQDEAAQRQALEKMATKLTSTGSFILDGVNVAQVARDALAI